MTLFRFRAPRWLWTVAALALAMAALSPVPADARQFATQGRISVSSTGVQGINIQDPVINADGNVVAFWSDKEGLIPGDTNFAGDVFVRTRTNNQTIRVSLGHGGVQTARNDGNLAQSYPDIDIDDSGCKIVYSSDAHNITQQNGSPTADVNNNTDVFLVDRCIGGFPSNPIQTLHVSKNYGSGQQAAGGNTNPKISGNGQFVLWRSSANNLVAGDFNNAPDIFIMDVGTVGLPISRVNISNGEAEANFDNGTLTFSPSDNGMIVAFASAASNLVSGDTNNQSDIFIRDRAAGTTIRIMGTGNVQPNGASTNPHISGNGEFVAFRSNATNLVPGDTNGHGDIFVYEIATGDIKRVSVSSEGTQGNFGSDRPHLSDNGRWVTFFSDATTLIYGDTNGSGDIFLHDRNTNITTRVSVRTDGNQGHGPSGQVSAISDNGSIIAWESFQDDIVGGDTNATSDVFVSFAGPVSPNNLVAVNKGLDFASLEWDDNANNDDSIVVQRRKQGAANFSNRQTLSASAESYTDNNLDACSVYFYRVQSVKEVNGVNVRSPSNIERVKTLGCPPGTFSLTNPADGETVINPERADFRWTASEEAATYDFVLTRSGTGVVYNDNDIPAASICDAVRCELPMVPGLESQLTNGNYTWTVVAENTIGDTEATNNPESFTVNTNLAPRSFNLFTPGQDGIVRDLDVFPGFTWHDNRDAAEYALSVVHISNNTRLGSVIDRQSLTPNADSDGLTCDFDVRVCTYEPTAGEIDDMENGTYAWTVEAESPGGTRSEADNGAISFVLNTGDIELMRNRGFENDNDDNGIPDHWTIERASKDKRKCNKPGKTVTIYGECAFVFKSKPAENSELNQSLADNGYNLTLGDQIQLNLRAAATSLQANKVKVKLTVKYFGGAFPKDKATALIPGGTYDFSAMPQSILNIDGAIEKITVKVTNKATSGKVTLDDFSLILLGADSPRGREGVVEFHPGTRIPSDQPRDGQSEMLPPPPPAVDGFRGQN